ncbi:prepilin peptidase [Aeromonas sp. MdU4]|uniref:prepilin peptidase n=1 Tax=Aeromonas sp. MdU4 TaxID=3342819 RepID=UPI0035B970E9
MLAVWGGAVLTSFGRLAVYRLPHQLGWREDAEPYLTLCSPASRCDLCRQPINLLYLLPVLGWCLAGGRCSQCGVRVSVCYPLVELVGGLGWLLSLVWFGLTAEGMAACLLWQVLLFLAEIDWREQWLPAVVTLPLFWVGLLFSPFTPALDERAWGGFTGFILMWFSMVVVGKWRKMDAMAGGDIALCTVAGVWLGFGRLPSFLLISAFIFILMAWPARRRGQVMVPMGPALAMGILICLVLPPIL